MRSIIAHACAAAIDGCKQLPAVCLGTSKGDQAITVACSLELKAALAIDPILFHALVEHVVQIANTDDQLGPPFA